MNKRNLKVTQNPIKPLLIKLTLPSIFGILGMSIFNIVDTYFVAKLGTTELAAISFTFPIVILFGSLILGLGTGIMALFSRAAGRHDIHEQRRLATSGFLLAMLVSLVITIAGFFTIEPVFRLLGASEKLLPHIIKYMRIWYLGAVFVVVPMIGDSILRGLGDTKTPSFVMLTSAVTNILIDPLLIFGIGPFPEMGVAGAAVATVFARTITMIVSLWIQIHREHLISFKGLTVQTVLAEWKSILYLGLPNSLVKMILPLAIGIFTAILARYGDETVAAFGVATKIEGFALAAIHALGITAAVFVGQNLGAGHTQRVKSGIHWLNIYSVVYGLAVFLIVAVTGKNLGALFTDSIEIQHIVGLYLLIVPIGYGCLAVVQMATSVLNVLHKPLHSGIIPLIQMFIINIPLAFLFSHFWGANGVFASIALADIIAGAISLLILNSQINPVLAKIKT